MIRPRHPDGLQRRFHAEHEGLHAAADLWFGFPVTSASIDLGQEPGSDRHGEVTRDSDEFMEALGIGEVGDQLMRAQVVVSQLIAYMGPEQQRRGYLPDDREMAEWPPPTARKAADEKLEGIRAFVRGWDIGDDEWDMIVGLARTLLATPEFMALADRIKVALLDHQTLGVIDLHRLHSPALDQAMAEREVQS
jgi:hypothetical protein